VRQHLLCNATGFDLQKEGEELCRVKKIGSVALSKLGDEGVALGREAHGSEAQESGVIERRGTR
jgi:hypothetical protein